MRERGRKRNLLLLESHKLDEHRGRKVCTRTRSHAAGSRRGRKAGRKRGGEGLKARDILTVFAWSVRARKACMRRERLYHLRSGRQGRRAEGLCGEHAHYPEGGNGVSFFAVQLAFDVVRAGGDGAVDER